MEKSCKIKYRLIFLLFTIHSSLVTIHSSFAQENKYNEVVKIVAEYTPTISDAYKINLNPKIEDTIVETPKLSYSINSVKMNTGFELEPIQSLRMTAEPLDKLYNSLLNVGFGNYTTPYVEYFYNTLQAKDYNIGFHIKHLSSNSNDGINGYNNSNYSDNEVNVYGKYFKQDYTLFGDVNYIRNVVHFYGHQLGTADSIQKNEDNKQIFSLIDINAGIMSNYHDPVHLDYELNFKYYNLSELSGLLNATENNLGMNGFVSKNVTFMSIAKSQTVMLSGGIGYFNNLNNVNTFMNTGNTLCKLVPELRTDVGKLKVNIGLNIDISAGMPVSWYEYMGDVSAGKPLPIKVYPIINANLALVNDMLYAYAGISGGVVINTLKSFSDENPFLSPDIQLLSYTNDKFEFSGGIKGSFSKSLSFNAGVTTTNAENLPLFVTDTTSKAKNRFTVVYDNVQILNLKGEVSWEQSEKLDIMLRGDYFNYTTTYEMYAWEKPEYDLSLTAKYHYNEQLIFKADLFGLFKIYEKDFVTETENNVVVTSVSPQLLKHIYDINLGAEYRFTKKLSAFLNLNNIGNYRYYRWYNYPSERFNFLAGVSYAF